MTLSTRIKATGKASSEANGGEAVLLAYANRGQTALRGFVGAVEGWESMADIVVDPALPRAKGIKSEHGEIILRSFQAPYLYCLSHDWSGILEIRRLGHALKVDLFSPKPHVVKIDTATGQVTQATQLEIREILNLNPVNTGLETVSVTLEVLSPERPITLARVSRNGEAGAVDLADLAGRDEAENWRLSQPDADSPKVLIGRSGSVELALPATAQLTFARAPEAGAVRVGAGGSAFELDLSGAEGSEVVVSVTGPRVVAAAPAFAVPRPALDSYDRLTSRFDPDRVIAIYTPRWKGVAASTRNLFDQHIPFPPVDVHPDQMTPADIRRYAEILLQTGGRRFVISGGDLFWLEMISHVHKADPDVRFDLLWHSNYVQMGEPHDWRLLTHWLKAYHEGVIRRIAVVKSGYERLLQGLGVDAVFIPNIVIGDPGAIVPTTVTDTVGLWLSGSTEYRKAPHASLLAMAQCAPLALKASGMQADARRMISDLGIPISRLWATPVAPDVMHREMRGTAATLYVTISECSPMLPLESLGHGVPCLIGPSSHLFREHAQLREHLIVSQPLSPGAIAEKLKDAIRLKAGIVALYRNYAVEEMQAAKAAVDAFSQ